MSSDITIRVENLSKKYRIGGPQPRYQTFRESITDALATPFRRVARLLRGNPAAAADLTDTIWALDDVSLTVEQGEVIGIIGRNGAGKSTLLKILSRITEPTKGYAEIRGRVGSLLEVGIGFHPELTGRENIYLNGAILGLSQRAIESRFQAIASFAEVEDFLDTPVKHFSSGMYLRLAFSVAAHLETDILLVDEVLAVGDTAFQKKCLRKIDTVAGQGRTVLFVSHNLSAIQALCSRTLVLANGSISFDGTTADAIKHYLRADQDSAGSSLTVSDYRTSTGKRYLTDVTVTDTEGHPSSIFEIGSDLLLKISLHLEEEVHEPQIGIGVNNILGTRVFTVKPKWQNQTLGDLHGPVEVTCRFRKVSLVPGRYYLKVTFGDYYKTLDVLEDIPAFEIVVSDHWGSGQLPTPLTQGVVLQDASWSTNASQPLDATSRSSQ